MICPSCFGTEGDRADEPPPPVHPAFREHDPSADCWCEPVLTEDGVYQHRYVM